VTAGPADAQLDPSQCSMKGLTLVPLDADEAPTAHASVVDATATDSRNVFAPEDCADEGTIAQLVPFQFSISESA
jgi:hypothetical protein